jgi:competence protein ComEC
MRLIRLAVLAAACAVFAAAGGNLEILNIDVEGGKCLLLVSPAGESLLVDLGWPAQGARKGSLDHILRQLRVAGLTRLDNLLISHFDIDHIGDANEFVSRFPVGRLFDHGDVATSDATDPRYRKMLEASFQSYAALRRRIPYTRLAPGARIPMKGVDVRVVASGGKLVARPGALNPVCPANPRPALLPRDLEDDQSTALLVAFGRFRLFEPVDLEAAYSHDLVCPSNRIGTVDVYLLNVHGQFKGISPAMLASLRAPVVILANGARKGGDAETWPALAAAPGPPDIWQIHYSENAGEGRNPAPDFIANLRGEEDAKGIRVSVEPGGAFTVTNERNGFRKTYRK